MDSIYYLGPLGDYPQREYHRAGSSPDHVGQIGERAADAMLAAIRHVDVMFSDAQSKPTNQILARQQAFYS